MVVVNGFKTSTPINITVISKYFPACDSLLPWAFIALLRLQSTKKYHWKSIWKITPSCSAYHVFTQVENILNQKTYTGRLKHCPTTEPSCALVKDLGPWVKIPPLLPIQIPRILIWKPDNGDSILIPFYSAAPVTHTHTHTHTHTVLYWDSPWPYSFSCTICAPV